MKQHRLQKKALALSMGWALALNLTSTLYGVVYAADATSEAQEKTDEAAEYSLPTITVEAKRPDWESKLSPGTVTIIRPDDYKGEQKTLPELLKNVPGVHVREVNGKGQYTTVSVRGSTAAQVGVFVDGVLFNLGGDAAADISTIPVKNVERIEVYRGYIPARFGGTYIGGVINIVTKRPSHANVSAQTGRSSWGGYTGSLQIDAPLASGSLMVGVNKDQSEGDFPYKNFQVPYRYGEIVKQYDQLAVTKLQNYNMSLDMLQNSQYGLGLNIGQAPFISLEEVQQAATVGSGFYNAVMSAGVAAGYSAEDLSILFSADWFAYDADFKKKWWAEQMAAHPELVDDLRYRKNNDYKNTDAIIKWQDDHWTAKATWKKIDRHLPWGLWTGKGYDNSNTSVDTRDYGFMGMKRQELTSQELLVARRDTVGNLEWGWSVNYLNQNKDYRNEGYDDPINDKGAAYWNQPLSVWSSYDSRRVGGAVDGSYKAGQNHMLEFMANWSKEKMDIDGWGMTDFRDGDIDYRRRFRNYFEQTLFNIQLQDTITLNKAEDFWFTPSVRYNSSTILGRSSRLKNDQHLWFHMEDEQQDSKVTWQMALKKKVNDHLTLRSTYGSYYRLLNLYEIAGDGAGIIPRPKPIDSQGNVTGAMFPVPEEGTQWDISAIWDDKILGADADIQLTYFGRKSENLLQLYRCGFDYFCYTNTARNRVNGVELQTNFSWDKWDVNMAGTYMHARPQKSDNSPTGDNIYRDIPQTYSPEWEGSLRLTYRPNQKTSIFTEFKYMSEMYVSQGWDKKQTPLTTVGLGIKHKFNKDFQMVVGVNDLFNKGPELRLVETGLSYDGMYSTAAMRVPYPLNTDCPTQGRTYYVTMQYKF